MYDLRELDRKRGNIDHGGRQAFHSIFGDYIVAQRTAHINVQFQYNISTEDVTNASTGTGTVTQAASCAVLNSGASAGVAKITSKKSMRYTPGYDAYAYFTAQFETAGNGSYGEIGLTGDADGYFIRFEDSGNGAQLAIVRRYNGTDSKVTQSNFNIDKLDGTGSGFTLNHDAINIYRINFGWLGIAPIVFEVYGGFVDGWIPFHAIDITNQSTTTTVLNPVLPMQAKAGGANNVVMRTACWSAGIVGVDNLSSARFGTVTNSDITVTANTLTNIISIRSVAEFQSKTNRVPVELMMMAASFDGTKTARMRIIKNATVAGASWSSYDATNSTIEYSTTSGAVTNGQIMGSLIIEKAGADKLITKDLGFKMMPGDSITLAALSSANTIASGNMRFAEYF